MEHLQSFCPQIQQLRKLHPESRGASIDGSRTLSLIWNPNRSFTHQIEYFNGATAAEGAPEKDKLPDHGNISGSQCMSGIIIFAWHGDSLSFAFETPLLTLVVQVLRYSALAVGVFYGFYHQAGVSAKTKMNQIDREYSRKESLIQKAKAEYTKKNLPPGSKTEGDDST